MFTHPPVVSQVDLKPAIIRNPLIVSPQSTLMEAIVRMGCVQLGDTPTCAAQAEEATFGGDGASCALVMEGDRLLGIVTAGDVVRLIAQSRSLQTLCIQEVMTQPVVTWPESALMDCFGIVNLLHQKSIQHLLLLDANDRVVGLLTAERVWQAWHPVEIVRSRQVQEAMTTAVVCTVPTTSVQAIAQLMTEHPGNAVVITQTGRNAESDCRHHPIGLITARDMVQRQIFSLDLQTCAAHEVMGTSLVLVRPQDSLEQVLRIIEQRLVQHVVVIDEQGKVLGRITPQSLLQLLNPLALYQRLVALEQTVFPLVLPSKADQEERSENPAMVLLAPERQRTQMVIQQQMAELAVWQNRYEIANRASGQIFYEWHPATALTIWGANTERILGYALAEMPTTFPGWLTLVHPDDRERLSTLLAQAIATRTPYQAEYRVQRHQGDYIDVDDRNEVVLDDHGDVIGLMGRMADITDRKQAEIALRASEAELQHLFACMEEYIFVLDGKGRYLRAAPTHRDSLSKVNQTLHQVFPAAIADHFLDTIQRVLATQRGTQLEYCLEILGQNRWFATLVSPLDADSVLWVARDISDRKAAETALYELNQELERRVEERTAALRESEERWQLAFQGNKDALWDWDLRSQKKFFSSRWKEIRGFGEDEIGEEPEECLGRIHPEDYDRAMAAVQEHLMGQTERIEIEYRSRCKDGSYIWLLSRSQALRDESGQAIRLIGSDTDISDRKRAEMQLQHLSARLELAIQSAQLGIWEWDVVNNIVIWDDRMYELYGVNAEDFSGAYEAWSQGIHPEDWPTALEDSRRALAGEQDYLSEFRVVLPDGRSRILKAHALVERNAQGEALRMIGVNYDITDRKQAELDLQMSQRFIEQIAEASPNILYLYDLQEHRNIYVNREIFTILGYTPAEIQAMGSALAQTLMHPEDLARLPARYAQLSQCAEGQTLDFEYRMRHAQGEWRWLSSRDAVFSRDSQGQVQQVIGTAQDISDRKRLEQAQNRLIAMLEASTDYILIADPTGTAIWNNAALKHLRGLDSEAVVMQQRPTDYHSPKAVELLEQEAVPMAIAHGSWMGENSLLDANGQEIPVSQLLLAHKSSQGEVEFFSTIMRDMRVRKEYEQRLERSNAELMRATRLKDEFLANMSHELRTPLNAILGMAEGLQEDIFGGLNDRQQRAIATIERSGRHLLALINDILEVSKIEAGKLELERAWVAVAHLCHSSVTFVKQQAYKKQIQLNVIVPNDLGEIAIDERRMRQVLINLLSNAVKFTPVGGRVILEVHREPRAIDLTERIVHRVPPLAATRAERLADRRPRDPRDLYISVIDTGIGIAVADQAKLFQPFIQVDSSLNRQYEGTGLGLTLVKQIVELHGGSISLQSALGHGSCFTICLPEAAPEEKVGTRPMEPDGESDPGQAAPDLPRESSPISGDRRTGALILLAEDNAANITTLASYLTAKGYRVLLARDGQEAIDLTALHQPDLIVMDIQMPGVDGLEAIQQIRHRPRDGDRGAIPIIALTALTMAGDRERCLAAGASDYIAKPVMLKQLTAAIEKLLDSP